MEAMPMQSRNAPLPMLVTLAGMAIVLSPLHEANAVLPMLVTLVGMVTAVSAVDEAKAPEAMPVTVDGMENAPAFAGGYKIRVVRVLLNKTPERLL